MSLLDNLPPDQRAVLSLLLRQGKSYADVAGLLHIDEGVVRERAQAALAALGPRETAGLTADRRGEVGDYLLGQQAASQSAATRDYLEGSASGRAWGRVVAGELRPLAAGALPEVPAEGTAVLDASEPQEVGAGAPPAPRTAGRPPLPRGSRLGGALLLVAIAAVIAVVAIVLATSGGGGAKDGAVTGKSATSSGSSTSTAAQVLAQAAMAPVQRGSKAAATAAVIAAGTQRALAFRAQNLPASRGFAYALWLANTATDAAPLGFLPPVKADGGATAAEPVCPTPASSATTPCLPSDYSRFKLIILTRERSTRPTRPGTVVLGGSFATR